MACVTQQEYKQIQTSDSWLLSVLLNIGPAKSTPVWVKEGASLTQNGGKGGGVGAL